MERKIRIEIKPGVLLLPCHFYQYHVGLILKAVEAQWPEESDVIVITRGAEPCPGGKSDSKHLIGKAFDFRTRHLPKEIDRAKLLHRIMNDTLLGMDYYGYFRRTEQGVEWIHIHYCR